MSNDHLVVLGAGPGGYSAAFTQLIKAIKSHLWMQVIS